MSLRWGIALLLGAAATSLQAADPAPRMGQNQPFYPGMYLETWYSQDDRDSVFDQRGEERDTAAPSLPGQTSFPEQRAEARVAWYFPMFESYDWLFFSHRLHTARVTLGYANVKTQGALARFIADPADDARTDADDLHNDGSGLTDLRFEVGSFIFGSENWREREGSRMALLALVGLNLPTGNYDRDAPVSAGTNTFAVHASLGLHARPWSGALLDAGGGYREYFKNQDAAFGGLSPTQQGDDVFWDASLTQRLAGGLYLGAFASGREGDPNIYENPRFATDPPAPPATIPESDNFPTPGRYQDGGTSLTSAGVSLSYFLTQRWLARLSFVRPLSGESGEFDLPYTNRQPAGCTVGAAGCTTTPDGSTHVDGYGPARSYASDRWLLSLSYNFGLGDAFSCSGCRK